jgi:hypothetical protein
MAKGNYSKLPPLRDVAEDLRDGADFDDICTMYEIAASTLSTRLRNAGYGVSGKPLRAEAAREQLAGGRGEGNYISGGVGGGDYEGLPITTVPHTRRRREFLGLDWSVRPATGPQWRYV